MASKLTKVQKANDTKTHTICVLPLAELATLAKSRSREGELRDPGFQSRADRRIHNKANDW